LSDRIGARPTVIGAALLGALMLSAISVVGQLPAPFAGPVFFVIVLLWGVTGWAFPPAQSSHLLSLAPNSAPLVLSLNASALYLGIAGGSLLGGLVLQYGSVDDLGWVGALLPLLAVSGVLLNGAARRRAQPSPARLG
jgi:predicted MFS family arabinose efflux permease